MRWVECAQRSCQNGVCVSPNIRVRRRTVSGHNVLPVPGSASVDCCCCYSWTVPMSIVLTPLCDRVSAVLDTARRLLVGGSIQQRTDRVGARTTERTELASDQELATYLPVLPADSRDPIESAIAMAHERLGSGRTKTVLGAICILLPSTGGYGTRALGPQISGQGRRRRQRSRMALFSGDFACVSARQRASASARAPAQRQGARTLGWGYTPRRAGEARSRDELRYLVRCPSQRPPTVGFRQLTSAGSLGTSPVYPWQSAPSLSLDPNRINPSTAEPSQTLPETHVTGWPAHRNGTDQDPGCH